MPALVKRVNGGMPIPTVGNAVDADAGDEVDHAAATHGIVIGVLHRLDADDVHVVIEFDDGHVRGMAEVPAADALGPGVGFAGDGDLHANARFAVAACRCPDKPYVSFRVNYIA